MEDFDIFTNGIEFTKPVYKNILAKFISGTPRTPSAPNYESGRKLLAEELYIKGDESQCALQLNETMSSSLRALAVYREEQIRNTENKLQKILSYVKPVNELINSKSLIKLEDSILSDIVDDAEDVENILEKLKMNDLPFDKKYMKYGSHNNMDNFHRILGELPKEWSIVQLTTPFNPNENLKPQTEFRTEIELLYITLLKNDYTGSHGPVTVCVPANVTEDGELPLFAELYLILHENFKTIEDAHFSNKKLVKKYWERREDIDLRMKSVLNVMSTEWLGGWSSLLTGQLVDPTLREKVVKLVDDAVKDWGFIKLTRKQIILLYNLLDSCTELNKKQIRTCIRAILIEYGNIDDIRNYIKTDNCSTCNKDFTRASELCLRCLTHAFEMIHHISLADGIGAFWDLATQIIEDWTDLKNAERHPVILIVDETIDTFPWETLPILSPHPVSRIENIHILYSLYKKHEKEIVNGYFCTKADVGKFVINPEKNLEFMENRMKSFLKYWCGAWNGHVGETPSPEEFLHYITKSDVFLYCGHGDGWQLSNGGGGGAAEGRCAVLLAGCGSVRLASPPGRAPPAAAHHHLHIAACPVVVGMLWEVTDLEVDKVITRLLSLFVPTDAPVDWPSVGKDKWSLGQIDPSKGDKRPPAPECDLLRAVCQARAATNFTMISSSLIVRGLPVRVASLHTQGPKYTT